jgi:hypothetical protein
MIFLKQALYIYLFEQKFYMMLKNIFSSLRIYNALNLKRALLRVGGKEKIIAIVVKVHYVNLTW